MTREQGFTAGQRVYHIFFGWAKVYVNVVAGGKILIDLEAKEVSYYVMGQGYMTYKRDDDGRNILRTPIDQIVNSPEQVPKDNATHLKKMALNATVIYD